MAGQMLRFGLRLVDCSSGLAAATSNRARIEKNAVPWYESHWKVTSLLADSQDATLLVAQSVN